MTVEPGLPLIHADRLQIEGVLQNLLSNAIDALQAVDPPRRLGVDLRRDRIDGVVVTIEDNGPGM